MDVEIDTGRTHQIRVHAALAGHQVAGDDKYGDRELNRELHELGLRRMFLHAASIAFEWPDARPAFKLTVPLPADLTALLSRLPKAGRDQG